MMISIFKQLEKMGLIKEYNIYNPSTLNILDSGEVGDTSTLLLKEKVKANMNVKKNKQRDKEYKRESNVEIIGEVFFNTQEINKGDIIEYDGKQFIIKDCIVYKNYVYIDAEE